MMINPEYLEPILRETEDRAESMVAHKLKMCRDDVAPEIAEAAIEGILRAITIHVGGGKAAFDLFTRAADTALVPALRTASSS